MTHTYTPFTRYNRLYKRFENRLYTRYDMVFDNRLNVCIHDTTGRQLFDDRLYRVIGA